MKKLYSFITAFIFSLGLNAQTCPDDLAAVYTVADTCTSANYAYTSTIMYDPAGVDSIFIDNFGNFGIGGDEVYGLVNCTDSSILIPSQVVNGGTLTGTGSFTYDFDTVIFDYDFNGDICQATFINALPSAVANVKQSHKVTCYPVPSNASVLVSFTQRDASIQVFNSIGQNVYSAQNQNNEITLYKENFGAGIYYIRVFNDPEAATVSRILFE